MKRFAEKVVRFFGRFDNSQAPKTLHKPGENINEFLAENYPRTTRGCQERYKNITQKYYSSFRELRRNHGWID